MKKEHWKEEPDDKDYPAAFNYLSLLIDPREAKKIVKTMKRSSRIDYCKAKNFLRASGLPHLGANDHQVEKPILFSA